MILKKTSYDLLFEKIKKENLKIVIYGAGMISQVIIPYLIEKYVLYDYVDCYIDVDERKRGKYINVGGHNYEIKSPNYLKKKREKQIILISNSKFYEVIEELDKISELDNTEAYIIAIMQMSQIQDMKPISITHLTDKPIIPKLIHYCWFGGGEKPDFLKQCIHSWKRVCPEYTIIEWNEENYDINKYEYMRDAYKNKKYSFVSDLARLDILYNHGGIYLDSDVSLVKKLDDCLYQKGFVGVEKWGNINTGGGCGFVKHHPMLKKLIDYRSTIPFIMPDGSFNCDTNGIYETSFMIQEGFIPDNTLQIIKDITVYPSYVMHPYDYMSGEIQKKKSTLSIHHFYGAWMGKEDVNNRINTQKNFKAIIDRMGVEELH